MNDRTARYVEQLRRVPVGSAVGMRLLHLLDDPDVEVRRIVALVEADPSMTAQLLRLANTVFYGASRTVASVDHAVRVCGFSVVRAFAAGAAAGVILRRDTAVPDGFHGHALAVAGCASVVARRCGIDPGEGLCAGLLHDLGVPVLARFDAPGWRRAHTAALADPARTLEIERAVLGTDHAALGAAVLATWRLPDRLVRAIAAHHDAVGTHDAPLLAVLQAGEALAVELGEGGSGEPAAPADAALAAAGWRGDVDELLAEAAALTTTFGELLTLPA